MLLRIVASVALSPAARDKGRARRPYPSFPRTSASNFVQASHRCEPPTDASLPPMRVQPYTAKNTCALAGSFA